MGLGRIVRGDSRLQEPLSIREFHSVCATGVE
jgi:hypothetical protein